MQAPLIPEAPAWIAALGLVTWAGVQVVKFLSQRRNGGGGNSFAQFNAVIAPLASGLASHTAALGTLNSTLTVIAERMSHLPTKAEALEMHRESRHAVMQPLTALASSVELMSDDVEDIKRRTEGSEEAIRLIREQAQQGRKK